VPAHPECISAERLRKCARSAFPIKPESLCLAVQAPPAGDHCLQGALGKRAQGGQSFPGGGPIHMAENCTSLPVYEDALRRTKDERTVTA